MAEMSSSVTAKTSNTNSAKEGKRSTKMIETKERWNVKGITDVSSTMVSHLDSSKKACFHEDQSTARKLVISSSHHLTFILPRIYSVGLKPNDDLRDRRK